MKSGLYVCYSLRFLLKWKTYLYVDNCSKTHKCPASPSLPSFTKEPDAFESHILAILVWCKAKIRLRLHYKSTRRMVALNETQA